MRSAPLAAALLCLAAPASAVTALGTSALAPALAAAPAQAQAAPGIASLGNPGAMRTGLPEPQVWTTMIIGFALVGFAARWRRPSAMPQA